MARGQATRVVECVFCGAVATVWSRRGPAPIYCSPAHRQAAYRERQRPPGGPVPRQRFRGKLESLQRALGEAAGEEHWCDARRLILDWLSGVGASDVSEPPVSPTSSSGT